VLLPKIMRRWILPFGITFGITFALSLVLSAGSHLPQGVNVDISLSQAQQPVSITSASQNKPDNSISTSISNLIGTAPLAAQPTGTNSGATSGALTIRADVQEANAKTGVITARGNVRLDYPARQVAATAATAQYFSQEQRIVLSGGVVITQQGVNSIRAETVTYLVSEGRFLATPTGDRQVETVYVVPDRDANQTPATATTPVEQVKPAFKDWTNTPPRR
jgi:lipopolysaccharide export system protein LptA